MNTKLYIFTLEKIEKRYTKQWYDYFKDAFGQYFDEVVYIDGKSRSDKIKKGRFLDINQTNIWKCQQIIEVAKLFDNNEINDGDIFFFADAWHPGITAIKYMSQLSNIKTKMFGYWHAGTYDPNDFVAQAGLGNWASNNEIGWFKALDGSFVATKFHKELILNSYGDYIKDNKIHVVGFPMDWHKVISEKVPDYNVGWEDKEDIIVFPHRTDPEKNPDMFRKLAKEFPQYKFIITTEVTNTKEEYYKLLKKAKIVFNANKQETFGIGTVEAMFLGAIPLVPNRLVFPELYSSKFVYNTQVGMKQKLEFLMNNYHKAALQKTIRTNVEKIGKQSLLSITKMSEVMLKSIHKW